MNGKETALIVVDTQRAVVKGKYRVDQCVKNILLAEGAAREAGALIAWVQHEDGELVRGSEGWRLAEGLEPKAGDLLVAKNYNSSFAATELDAALRARGVKTVILAGAATNWCIRATAYGALERGYDLVILSDAHVTGDLETLGGMVIPAEVLIEEFNVGVGNVEYPGVTVTALPAAELRFA